MTYRSRLKSSNGSSRSIQSAIGGRPMTGITEKSVEAQVATDTTELDAMSAQLSSLQSQLAAAGAQAVVDATTITNLQGQVSTLQAQVSSLQAQATTDSVTIASLNAQVISLQAQVVALQNQINNLGLDKIAQFKIVVSYSELGGGIYVPPSYDNLTVNYTPIFKLQVKTLSLYTTIGGAFP